MSKVFGILILALTITGCQSTKVIHGDEIPIELKVEHLLTKAEAEYKAGELKEAELLFKEVLKLDGKDEQALYRLGNIAFRKGDQKSSAQYFTKVVAINPKNAKAHYNLGTIHLMYAEEHMKFFTATAPRDFDISGVSTLLGQLNEFSAGESTPSNSGDGVSDEKNENLDKLVNLIESH
ncbi:MAG: tetratricopeptide repeat protein [Pseudomonadales bacterium]|nr:tetratricopeptide repeat protein [Pseudomonadales bacterium]